MKQTTKFKRSCQFLMVALLISLAALVQPSTASYNVIVNAGLEEYTGSAAEPIFLGWDNFGAEYVAEGYTGGCAYMPSSTALAYYLPEPIAFSALDWENFNCYINTVDTIYQVTVWLEFSSSEFGPSSDIRAILDYVACDGSWRLFNLSQPLESIYNDWGLTGSDTLTGFGFNAGDEGLYVDTFYLSAPSLDGLIIDPLATLPPITVTPVPTPNANFVMFESFVFYILVGVVVAGIMALVLVAATTQGKGSH